MGGPGEEESLRIADQALALGCTLFDTVPGYAERRSEELPGKALRRLQTAAPATLTT